MTRVKKEFRKKGFQLETDYEFLPCNGIEEVRVDPEKARYSVYHVSAGWTHFQMLRNGETIVLSV